ncbi:hypothetical protein JOB18_019927 [Solea senegalensis]|uniref:Uncharacterized protein n=1 Tax=Solea senegalensis TaxID=28829 RepID=A0AAV6PTU0_SOLSE|nr:hypothetical protein JOB18_019927 [Solea senegalensis]
MVCVRRKKSSSSSSSSSATLFSDSLHRGKEKKTFADRKDPVFDKKTVELSSVLGAELIS